MLAYVDSSVWIPLVEENNIKHKKIIEKELEILIQGGWKFCVSHAVLLETLYKPYLSPNKEINQEWIKGFHEIFAKTIIIPNYLNMLEDSFHIMQTEKLKAMDAIHVALAKHHNCEGFVSTDTHFKNLQSIKPLWIDLGAV